MEVLRDIDVRPVLPHVHAAALVLHALGLDPCDDADFDGDSDGNDFLSFAEFANQVGAFGAEVAGMMRMYAGRRIQRAWMHGGKCRGISASLVAGPGNHETRNSGHPGALQDFVSKQAVADPRYREALLKNPKSLMEKHLGRTLPDWLHVKVVEETADTVFLVAPHVAGEELVQPAGHTAR